MKQIFGKVYTDDLTGKKLRAYVIDDIYESQQLIKEEEA